MSDDDVLFEELDGIATITLNRPRARNALSVGAANRLHALWGAVDVSESIRAVILTSADCGTFCAGMDLKEAAHIQEEQGIDVLTLIKDPMHQRMRRARQPIIAAMTGHATAGGMLLSLNADLRVGLSWTSLGITEVKMGRGSPWAVPLVSMMPQPLLMELVLTGELMPIERFHALGFVNYVEGTPEAVRQRAQEKTLDLACHIMPEVPPRLVGDSLRLRQILTNLAGNAVKFTHQGHVWIRVEQDPFGASPGDLRFCVEDTGIGIPEAKKRTIFDNFTQAVDVLQQAASLRSEATELHALLCRAYKEANRPKDAAQVAAHQTAALQAVTAALSEALSTQGVATIVENPEAG